MRRKACTESQCLYKGALYLYLYLKDTAVRRQPLDSFIRKLLRYSYDQVVMENWERGNMH